MNIVEIRRRRQEIAQAASQALRDEKAGTISTKEFKLEVDRLQAEHDEVEAAAKAYGNALRFSGGSALDDGSGAPPRASGGSAIVGKSIADDGQRLAFTAKMAGGIATQMMADSAVRGKALAPSGASVVSQDFTPDPVALGQVPQRLLDVLPVKPHGTQEYAYLRQSVRTNNVAVVAEGAVKPTSVYSLVRVEESLAVVAHLSEGVPRYWLLDNEALTGFINNEMHYGLRLAVEAKIVADINATSGIQSQVYGTSIPVTLRKAITKLEAAGYVASSIVLTPADFETVELALSTQNAIEHLSLPFDPATRHSTGCPS